MLSKLRDIFAASGVRAMIAAAMLAAPVAAASGAYQSAPAPTPAPAHEIRVGETISGSVPDAEPSELRYEDYRLTLNAGEMVQIDLESEEFDTLLRLLRPGVERPIDENDDRGDTQDSRLIVNATERTDYVIRAGPLFSGSGAYRLTVTRMPSAPPAAALAAGRTLGQFQNDSPFMPGLGGRTYRYALYEFRGAPGDRVRIDMTSTPLDSRLELLAPDGSVLVMADRGGAGDRDARLVASLTSEGMHKVRASAPAPQAGAYEIEFRQSRPPVLATPRTLAWPTTITEGYDFDSAAEMLGDSSSQIRYFYKDFLLSVRPGQVLTLFLESRDFDPYLEVGVMSPLGLAIAARDDDGGGSLNSRLVLRPLVRGLLHVRTRSLGLGTGCYTLRIVEGDVPAARPTSRVPLPPPARNPQACSPAAPVPAQPQ